MQTKRQLKQCTRNVHPSFADFWPRLDVNFHILLKLTLGVKLIFTVSLMHTLSDKVRFVQRELKPEEAFTTKKWMVLAEHLLAQAQKFTIDFSCVHVDNKKACLMPLSRDSSQTNETMNMCHYFF